MTARPEADPIEALGLYHVHARRYRDVFSFSEVELWPVVGAERAWHIEQHAPPWLGLQPAHGTHALMREVVRRATALGWDAFLTDNNPKRGGMLTAPPQA